MSGSKCIKGNSHSKARTSPYPGSKVERSQVPNEKVGWLVEWQDYNPVEYTAVSVLAGPMWADPQISETNFSPKFNEKDGHVERKSKNGLYEIQNGRPRNPAGRTGLVGRGLLGRWGPNHAADPIITRWKKNNSGNKITHPVSGKHILQFVAIKRKDCGEWAIPGVSIKLDVLSSFTYVIYLMLGYCVWMFSPPLVLLSSLLLQNSFVFHCYSEMSLSTGLGSYKAVRIWV